MKRNIVYGFFSILLSTSYLTHAQSITIESANGNSSSIELASIESIVFSNANLVIHKTDQSDNYHSVFLSQKLVFGATNSIDDHLENKEIITLFPNPATQTLTLSQAPEANTEFYIVNYFGEVVQQVTLSAGQRTIHISTLTQGLYFLISKSHHLKFIKL